MRSFLLFFLCCTALGAEIKPIDPGFPARESLVYTETTGTVAKPYETSLTVVGQGPGAVLEYRTKASDGEALYRLDLATLLTLSADTVTRTPDATLHQTYEYTNLKPSPKADELVVTNTGSLPVVMRGFPWTTKGIVKVYFAGSAAGASGFSFEIQVVGRDKLTAAGRTWDCYRVTLGLGGALSFLMAKSELWFAVDGSHPLIKSVGPAGGPGSPTRTLLLQSIK